MQFKQKQMSKSTKWFRGKLKDIMKDQRLELSNYNCQKKHVVDYSTKHHSRKKNKLGNYIVGNILPMIERGTYKPIPVSLATFVGSSL